MASSTPHHVKDLVEALMKDPSIGGNMPDYFKDLFEAVKKDPSTGGSVPDYFKDFVEVVKKDRIEGVSVLDYVKDVAEPLMKDPPTYELIIAVCAGHEAGVRSALARGGRPKVTIPAPGPGVGGSVCLVMFAAKQGHHHLLPVLLHAGLSVEGGGTDDMTPLMAAAMFGRTQTVKALLSHGAKPLATNSDGWTALHYAARWGHLAVVEWLVKEGGGDTSVQDKHGQTALDLAVAFGCHKVESWLLKNSGGDAVQSDGRRVADAQAWRGMHEDQHNKVLQFVVEGNQIGIKIAIPKDYDGHALSQAGLTPLHAAALCGAASNAVAALLGCGVSPHVFTPDNNTPTKLAVQQGHGTVVRALLAHRCEQSDDTPEQLHEELLTTVYRGDSVEAVCTLICKEAPIDPFWGQSVLKQAVINDRARTVSLLLARGASLSANLLQEAWQSPNVTGQVLDSLATAYCCRLRVEQHRLEQVSDAFADGINNLLRTIEGNAPWQAAWRWGKDIDRPALSDLLATASAANCPVTAAFLQRAGAWSFFSRASSRSALHSALMHDHQAMAELLIRELEACPYVPDTKNCLPLHMMKDKDSESLEQRLFEREREKLENMVISFKADDEKKAAQTALCIQEALFERHKKGEGKISSLDASGTMLLVSRKGLLQLVYLILHYTPFPVDKVLDDTCGITALHQAASHGQDGCVELLLSAGANKQHRDTYGHTPRHLAAMSGHKSTFELLAHEEEDDPPCRAGTTATQVKENFKIFHSLFYKHPRNLHSPSHRLDSQMVLRNLVNSIGLAKLQEEAQRVAVDLSEGEALEVKQAVMAEVSIIMSKVSAANPTYSGELRLAGSSRDGSKLYAPDEFDINLVIHEDDIRVDVSERAEQEAPLKGRLQVSVITEKAHLKGNNFMANLFEDVRLCLANHILEDKRLSLVPPGVTSTQVGVALSLAWQGQQYPLLLVGVDLVPVLEVPWLEQVSRPYLTPKDTTTMQLSNAADGSWRCSFALTEAKVLETLSPIERLVQVMAKVLLSRLKALPWMSRHKKDLFKWNAGREFNVAVPSGFCLKNAVLRWVEQRLMEEELGAGREGNHAKELVTGQEGDHAKELVVGQEGDHAKELWARQKGQYFKEVGAGRAGYPVQQFGKGRKEDPARCLVEVFRLMCANPKDTREDLATTNSFAYFGGDCEGRKSGEGAPVIVQCLEKQLEELAADKAARQRYRQVRTARPRQGKYSMHKSHPV